MKFTIRDLLWLMVLAAVLTAWGVDHWKLTTRIQALEERPLPHGDY